MNKQIIFFLVFLFSTSLFAQISEYYKNPFNVAVLEKIETLQNNLSNEEMISYTRSILDTLSSKNIDLRLALLAKNGAVNYRAVNYEEFYRNLKEYDKLANKSGVDAYIFKSKLMIIDFYTSFNSTEKAFETLKITETLITPELIKNNPGLVGVYYQLKMKIHRLNNEFEEEEQASVLYLNLISKIDTTIILNKSSYITSLINYADYIDRTNQNVSFKYYNKANHFALKHNLPNLSNFAKMRLSGCLINKNEVHRALDTLRVITKTNTETSISFLHYYVYINAFEQLNMPDSVAAYKIMLEELNAFLSPKVNKMTKSVSMEDVVKKVELEIEEEEQRNKILNFMLFISICLGFFTTAYILKSLKT